MIDATFPLSELVSKGGYSRKVNMVLTDHNQKQYQHTIVFIESLLPLDNTLKTGGLPADDNWALVHIYALEFINSIQTERVIATDLNTNRSLIWGSFKATDMADEYKKQKFIKHPDVCSILAPTSIEREGWAVAEALETLCEGSEPINALGSSNWMGSRGALIGDKENRTTPCKWIYQARLWS